MQITVSTNDLRAAVSGAMKAIDSSAKQPILASFLLRLSKETESIYIISYDGRASITAQVRGSVKSPTPDGYLSCCIMASVFNEFVSRIMTDDVKLTFKKDSVNISTDEDNMDLGISSAAQYPVIPRPGMNGEPINTYVFYNFDSMHKCIDIASHSTSDSADKLELTGVWLSEDKETRQDEEGNSSLVKKLTMFATDGKQATRTTIASDDAINDASDENESAGGKAVVVQPELDIVLPPGLLSYLKVVNIKNEAVVLSVSDKNISFHNNSFMVVSAAIDAKYNAAAKRMVPPIPAIKGTMEATIERTGLIATLEKAMLLSTIGKWVYFHIDSTEQEVIAIAGKSDMGSGVYKCAATVKGSAKYRILGESLIKILKSLGKSTYVQFVGTESEKPLYLVPCDDNGDRLTLDGGASFELGHIILPLVYDIAKLEKAAKKAAPSPAPSPTPAPAPAPTTPKVPSLPAVPAIPV